MNLSLQSSEIQSISFSTSITSGTSSTKSFTNSGDYILECWAINGSPFVYAADNSNSNFPLEETSDPKQANNDMPARAMLRVRIVGSSLGPWVTPTDGVRYSNLVGTAQKPFYFNSPFRVLPKETVNMTLYNDSASTIRDEVTFVCRKLDARTGQPI